MRDTLVGALVALMLLLPAVRRAICKCAADSAPLLLQMSFLVGGLRFREQRFNLASMTPALNRLFAMTVLSDAGLSTVMLVVSVIGTSCA